MWMNDTYNDILKIFGDKPAEMLDMMNVFGDSESRSLLDKLTGADSPLMADNLPYTPSKGTKLSNLSRLQTLIKLGLVEEKEIHEGRKIITRYHSTSKADIIMEKISKL